MSGYIAHLCIAYGLAVLLYVLWVRELALRRRTQRDCRVWCERTEAEAIRYVRERRIEC